MASKSSPVAAGSSAPANGSRAPLSSVPRSSDQLPAMRSKEKPKGLHDDKARELEQEFKARHIGVLGVLAWIL